MRIYWFSDDVRVLPSTLVGLEGRAKSYKVNLPWQAAANAEIYRIFRKLNGEAAFSERGTTTCTAIAEHLPDGTASANDDVVAKHSEGERPPSAIVTVIPRSR